MSVPGGISAVQLGETSDNAMLNIGIGDNPDQQVTLCLVRANNLIINSDLPIKTLKVSQWIDDDLVPDMITAPFLGSLVVSGNSSLGLAADFQAGLNLTSPPGSGQALGSLSVKGTVSKVRPSMMAAEG